MKSRITSSSQRKNRSSSKGQVQYKSSFDNSAATAVNSTATIPKAQFRSFNKFSSMHQEIDLTQIQNMPDSTVKGHSFHQQKQVQTQQRPHTSQLVRRHNEYNNNEEDYTKQKKDELIKTLFKKRKEKMLSMETPKQNLTHHVSATTFDGISYHHHNFSQFENPTSESHKHTSSISKIINNKKYRKIVNERTHTPPPPTTQGKINNEKSNEKSMQNSSSFISKKQTAYIKPKNPDEVVYVPNTINANNRSNIKKTQKNPVMVVERGMMVNNNNKINININNNIHSNIKKEPPKHTINSISERQQRPDKQIDEVSMLSSFSQNSQAQNIQNFQLNKNINVKIQQAQILNYRGSFNAHNNTVTDLEIDYNQNMIFSSSLDYSVKVWNLQGSQINQKFFDSNIHSPFSQGNSSLGISSGSITPAFNFTPVKKIESRQKYKVNSLVYLPASNILATGGTEKQIKLYDFAEKGDLMLTIKGNHSGVINDMCMINNDQIATACSDQQVRMFSLSNNKDFNKPVYQFSQQNSSPNLICQQDQNTFSTSGLDRGVRIWDMRLPNPILFFQNIHYDQITSIDRLSANIFATASDDGCLNLWDIRMEKLLKQIRFEDEKIGCIKFLKQSYLIAAHGSSLSIMNIRDNFSQKQVFNSDSSMHDSFISTFDEMDLTQVYSPKAIAYSELDKKIYIAGSDKRIHIWSFNSLN